MLRDWPAPILAFTDVHNGLVTAVGTIVIAAFTIVLAFVTRRQAFLTTDAIKLARDEFNATHRPKLRVRLIRPHLADGKPISVRYTIVNIGGTRAILKRHDVKLYAQPANNGIKAIQQSFPLACHELKPGESEEFFLTSKNIEFEYEFHWDFAAGGVLKIGGVVEYEDGVGIMRRTGFLRTYDVALGCFRKSEDTEEEYED